MGTYTIKVPDIGEGIAEVELVAWHVQPGDAVEENQVLVDVMTDKATVEIPSPVQGRVLALGGAPGQAMAVGGELMRLQVGGAQGAEEGAQASPAAAAGSHAEARVPEVAEVAEVAARPSTANFEPVAAAPLQPHDRPIASPSVRRRAWESDIDLARVPAGGPAGRITHRDLDDYIAAHKSSASSAAPPLRRREGELAIPLIGLRRRIAQKMQEAKRRIPHFSYVEEIDVTELEAVRAQLNGRHAERRGKLTLLPFIARAMVLALEDFPALNARFDDEAGVVTRFAAVHLGVATQTDAGLMVPVIRHAEAQDLWGLAREIARLAEGARSGQATRDELGGSTITLTSLGALGGIASTPVINHPEVAIIGVNRVVERPMFQGSAVVPRRLMNLSSSFDHRVIDGMDAARFVQAVRALLEAPALLLAA